MPIIQTPRADAALTQGDILNGIALFATKAGGEDTRGGQAALTRFELCLVLSRPCAAAHKKHVIVAGIAKYPDAVPKGIDSFDKVLDFLIGARDGLAAPDVFYLGQLPGITGRFCARLDSLHTIEIPEEAGPRAQFLLVHRLATLHPDFARDLHLRLFAAFASLGFDDAGWTSTEDLQWLATQGQADIAAAELAVRQWEASQSARAAEGTQFKEADLSNAQRRLDQIRQRVHPYEQELARRRQN